VEKSLTEAEKDKLVRETEYRNAFVQELLLSSLLENSPTVDETPAEPSTQSLPASAGRQTSAAIADCDVVVQSGDAQTDADVETVINGVDPPQRGTCLDLQPPPLSSSPSPRGGGGGAAVPHASAYGRLENDATKRKKKSDTGVKQKQQPLPSVDTDRVI